MKSFLILAGVVSASTILLVEKEYEYTHKYSTYHASRMAYFLMDSPTVDEVEDEECDGSGWITHGDGHRTPCPGCGKCKPNKKTSAVIDEQYKMYFFTADWCTYCKKMKRDTWSNKKVIKALEEKGVNIYTWDYDNAFHKKYFEYYNVKSMPTILIFKDGDLRDPVVKQVGYLGPEELIKILEAKLNE